MKKLLSLLNVLTISCSAIPTTIAASLYQKEENLNSYSNYLQTNDAKNVNRNKRNQYDFVNLIDLIKKSGYLLSGDVRGSNYGGYSNICGTKGQKTIILNLKLKLLMNITNIISQYL